MACCGLFSSSNCSSSSVIKFLLSNLLMLLLYFSNSSFGYSIRDLSSKIKPPTTITKISSTFNSSVESRENQSQTVQKVINQTQFILFRDSLFIVTSSSSVPIINKNLTINKNKTINEEDRENNRTEVESVKVSFPLIFNIQNKPTEQPSSKSNKSNSSRREGENFIESFYTNNETTEGKVDNGRSVILKRRTKSLKRKNNNNKYIKRKTLTILGLFELSYNNNMSRESGESERMAAQLALDDINANDQILPGYQLAMHTNDTQCDAGSGVDAFFHALYMRKDSKIISLLGTACSEVTERLAKVATHQRIVQVSFGSTSPSLSDRKEFPLFYRTVAPVSSHAKAIIELIRHFKWDTVSFFTKNENSFTMPVNHLVKELEEKGNITCKATLTFSISDFRDQLQDMKDLDSRIIIGSFGTDVAPHVFCEVYRMGMYGRDYAWILIGKPETSWWKNASRARTSRNNRKYGSSESYIINSNTTHLGTLRGNRGKVNSKTSFKPECSLKQLTLAIENTLVVDRFNVLNRMSDFGLTTEAFSKRLKEASEKISIQHPSPFAPETYDAVWTVALGLKQLQQKYNYSLENFNYMDDEFSHTLNEEIGRLNFTGISGPINFLGADRIGISSIMQIQGGNIVQVGLFHPDRPSEKLELWSVQWPGNQIPIARREFRFKLIRVEDSLYIIVTSLAFCGILMAAAFLAFNLYYRKLKYIKLSSPRLNNMVIIGCMFAYVAVIILGSDFSPTQDELRFSYICTIRAYLLSMGFSLSFGAMFAKTYRVHRIFTRSCIGVVKNKLLKDTQLMTLIMALLLIDVIIVTSWAVFDPMHRHLRNLTLQIDPSDRSVVYQPQIEVCRSQYGHIWQSVIYILKFCQLVLGIWMAWETRHVKIQALNDSKSIATCVYIVVVTSVLAVSLANLISERVTLSFLLITSLILTSTTVTLCLLFLPKIHAIKTGADKKDPVIESMGLKIECNTRRLVIEDPSKELMFRAEVQNRVYKRQIEAIDVEIWRLENLLLCSSHSSLTSLENPRKQDQKSTVSNDKENSLERTSSDENSSEIYTVYLHGPRFIVPISVLNFQNPNALTSSSNTPTCTTGKKTSAPTPSTISVPSSGLPRSSWPNIRSLLAPSNGLIAKKYLFKSEPKLLIEELESGGDSSNINPSSNSEYFLQPPQPTMISCSSAGESDENFIALQSKSSKPSVKSLRKSSNTSCGGGAMSSSKRSSLLSVLKHPLAYFSGVIRSSGSPTNNIQLNPDSNDTRASPTNPPLFHLSPPRERQKYSSVPDLWAVRGSPVLQRNRKKTSAISDSVVETLVFKYLSSDKPSGLSVSNPVLQLTVTSDESHL